MDLSWIEKNYSKLKEIAKKVSKQNNADELLHFCIDQYMKNSKASGLTQDDKIYFFTRILRNNFNSMTSPYAYAYKKRIYQELSGIEIAEQSTEEFDELAWVHEQIQRDKKYGDWYYARLFEIYIEQGASITKTSEITTIPRNSVSRDINKYRKILRKRRELRK
jgi:hypothetical protein